ncbi:hypothetical protein DFH06DRAFT_1133313 [Mycena polygramma]|nr:hypothetical protein DFH06DRAFT_1133313 [Mycena polygramma]
MSSIGEDSISLLESAVPTSTTSSVLTWALILAFAAYTVFYTSPMRLTAALITALHETEETHLRAIEAGIISGSDAHTKTLSHLQMKVSLMRETSLYSSLSSSQALWELAKGHSFALLQCIWEVQELKTRIESVLPINRSQDTPGEAVDTTRWFSRPPDTLAWRPMLQTLLASARSEKEKCGDQRKMAVNQDWKLN